MRRLGAVTAILIAALALTATPVQAVFDLTRFEVAYTEEDGSPATQAGSHPYALTTSFGLPFKPGTGGAGIVDGKLRDAFFEQVAGLVGDATAIPRCSTADFLADRCSLDTVVGIQAASVGKPGFFFEPTAIHNLEPPAGTVLRLGWEVENVVLVVDAGIKQGGEYNAVATTRGVNQTLAVFASVVELWGVPGDPAHDSARGRLCAEAADVVDEKRIVPDPSRSCPSNAPPVPFLTLPRSCEGPATTRYEVRSWQEPERWVTGSYTDPNGFSGCEKLGFSPGVQSLATTDSAETATGLDFSIDFRDEGLKNPSGLAQSEIKKAVVTLPSGMTLNPSVAEGLGVCTPDDLVRETIDADPGEGCPNSSNVGTVSVRSPLVEDAVEGSVFIAQQDDPRTSEPGAENPFDSLFAFYIVLKNPDLGILVKQAAKVEPDPRTGQLITTVDDIPQIPFSRFTFHFREGQRAPLISPPTCGAHTTTAELIPRANPSQLRTVESSFTIASGVGGGACPAGGVPPFEPGFVAGALNNNAKSFSPFLMRLTRRDGDQDLTRFSAVLPPGLLGKLAGVAKCSDARIAAARSSTGRDELAAPSCPAGSKIGTTEAGAGVGAVLARVSGSLYLAGPYKGAPLSVVAVTPAVAGPFDAGTVVVRAGLTLNPRTAEVEVVGASSDPIPHILKGVVLKLRELYVDVNRPEFTLNPTSCEPSSTRATVFGSFLDVFSPSDDVSVARSSRHQVANCARLPFRPRISMRLKGGTRRGAHPSLRAMLLPRQSDANVKRIVARLPGSAFLEQAHIRTICTRVQFAADNCPKAAIYGRAAVFTPLLDEPLRGPVYLRSSNNELPDLVLDLHGIVDIEAAARIDSVRGGIRATFNALPDAPISRAVLRMQGGKKGLIVNSRSLCTGRSHAALRLQAQSGRQQSPRPLLRAQCGQSSQRGSQGR